jgi:hypothetical protein
VPSAPFVDKLLQPDVLGSEAQFFRVHQLDLGPLAGVNHSVGLGQVQTQGLLAEDVLAGLGRRHGCLRVQVIGKSEHNEVQVAQLEHLAKVGEPLGNAVTGRERGRMGFAGRRDSDHLSPRHRAQGLQVDGSDKLRADQTDPNNSHDYLPGETLPWSVPRNRRLASPGARRLANNQRMRLCLLQSPRG